MRFKQRCDNMLPYTILRLMDSNGMYYKDNNIIFDMQHIWFEKEHPFNMTDRACVTGRAVVVLENVTFRKCSLTKSDATTKEIGQGEDFTFENLLIHEFDEVKTDTGFLAYMNILFYDTSENYSLLIEAEYRNSHTFWNDFKATSWFQKDM